MKFQEDLYNSIKARILKEHPDFDEQKIKDVIDGYWRGHRELMKERISIRYYKFGTLEYDEEKKEKYFKAKRKASKDIEKIKKEKGAVSLSEMRQAYTTAFTEFSHIKPLNRDE